MKKNKMVIYRIFRSVLGPIYRFWYHPVILGKENIPKDGPIVVVGNHIHIMDQCNVIISTKRKIHYMAKKEYFDPQYKEGHHGWFFRSAGCIPVDRSIHDESAKSAALDVLKEGHALGLFPEGTRNGLKEERLKELYDKYEIEDDFSMFMKNMKEVKTSQVNYLEELFQKKIIKKEDIKNHLKNPDSYLLELVKNKKITKNDYEEHLFLPFKFGAVSMANKMNAKIVPFVITGKYQFRSKNLKVQIGEAITPTGDLEKDNQNLRSIMLSMFQKNGK